MYHCSCLCQEVKFDIELRNLNIEICHCSMCRKMMGSSGFLGLECSENISLPVTEKLSIYHSSNKGRRGFCNNCGTSLFYYFIPEKKYFIPVGIIDNLSEKEVKITTEIYYDNKPCYYDYANQTKKMLESDFC